MANRSKTIDITKRGPGTGEGFEVDFIDILTHPRTKAQVAQIVADPAPVAYLERKVGSDPEDWDDVTSDVSINGLTVVNGEGTMSAVKGSVAADKDNTPPAGGDYQLVIEVTLDNGQGEAGFAPVRIWPSAAVPSS